MTEELKLKLRQLKSKNNKIKSSYLHLNDSNIGRARALATFTVPAMTDKRLQLFLVKEIKNYFSKRLQNLKVDVNSFSAIELGQQQTKLNPHLHVQLWYDEEDVSRVETAYQKTIEYFSLIERRCKLVKESSESPAPHLSYNYIIKEFDNLKLSDKEILELDSARKRLKQGENKYIQFHSQSRSLHPKTLYKALWFKHNLTYINVNTLMSGYATRLQGLKLLEARQINELPFILFKDGSIQVNSSKLYKLILLALLFIRISLREAVKSVYIKNKRNYRDNRKLNFYAIFKIYKFKITNKHTLRLE